MIEIIELNNTASIKEYKMLCEIAKQFDCFKACGDVENMWIEVRFKDVSHRNKFYDLLRK